MAGDETRMSGFADYERYDALGLAELVQQRQAPPGPTRNPWDPTRISGGSSGGAAAAVGARMLPMAHATDGFGSIRAPAACCGLIGLKPTRGRNTMAPYLGEGLGGLSAEHAVTLSVRDCAALLDATAGAGAGDPYAAPPAGPLPPQAGAPPPLPPRPHPTRAPPPPPRAPPGPP